MGDTTSSMAMRGTNMLASAIPKNPEIGNTRLCSGQSL